jgi:hypothetical protein
MSFVTLKKIIAGARKIGRSISSSLSLEDL